MSTISGTASQLIETVYHRAGVNATTRLDLIRDTCEQFSRADLDKLSPPHAAATIRCLATVACRESLEVVSRGNRHTDRNAQEVFACLGVVANLVVDTSNLDLEHRAVLGANSELGVMGALWAGLASGALPQPGHARFSTEQEDKKAGEGALRENFDIVLTSPSPRQQQPRKTKLQVKRSEQKLNKEKFLNGNERIKRYADDITPIIVEHIVPESPTPELHMIAHLAMLDVDTLSQHCRKIMEMIRVHKAMVAGRAAAYGRGQEIGRFLRKASAA